MSRLDEIEARWSENEQWARDLDLREETIMAEDVRALVAVAREAETFIREREEMMRALSLRELRLKRKLAPLLASKEGAAHTLMCWSCCREVDLPQSGTNAVSLSNAHGWTMTNGVWMCPRCTAPDAGEGR